MTVILLIDPFLKPCFMKKIFYSLVVTLLACSQSFANDSTKLKAPDSYLRNVISDSLRNHRKIRLDLYVMSMCPFGTRAENALIPILKEKGDSIEFNILFIADESPERGFQSLHGRREVLEDRRQLVIARHFPDKLIDYLRDRTINISSPQWYASAAAAALNIDSIDELTYTAEEIKAFSTNIAFSKQNRIAASPSLFINGVAYNGPFTVNKGKAERLVCNGGPNKDNSCPTRTSEDGCDICVGGKDNGKSCDVAPHNCPNLCKGGPDNGTVCPNQVECHSTCFGPFPNKDCSTGGDESCKFCDGGPANGTGCTDSSNCFGSKCVSFGCNKGTCEFGSCSRNICIDVGNSSCCLAQGGCITGRTHDECKPSGSNNLYNPEGACGPDACLTATATVPSLRAIYTPDTKSIQITWRLEPGMDNTEFSIYRSRNAERFNEIGYAPIGAGSSGTFTFTDIEPFPVGYYRLTFTKDDKLTYSQTITVVSFEKSNLVLQPNPATGKVSILFTNMQMYTTSVSFFDISGRQVLTHSLSPGESEVNISNLPQGLYIVKAMQNGKTYTGKLEKN